MTQPEALPDKSSLPALNAEELTHLYREMLLILNLRSTKLFVMLFI